MRNYETNRIYLDGKWARMGLNSNRLRGGEEGKPIRFVFFERTQFDAQSRLPEIEHGAFDAVDRVGPGEGDAGDIFVGLGTFAGLAVTHVPFLPVRIGADDGEVVGGAEVLMAGAGGDD